MKFEYCIVFFDGAVRRWKVDIGDYPLSSLTDLLNILGAEGWEVVGTGNFIAQSPKDQVLLKKSI